MNKPWSVVKSHTTLAFLLFIVVFGMILGARILAAQSAAEPTALAEDALIADFRRVEVASVSDALEQTTGKRMYMSSRMHPIFTTKFDGFARTVVPLPSWAPDSANAGPAR